MKKIVLLAIISMAMVGCTKAAATEEQARFKTGDIGFSNIEIITDSETGCQYLYKYSAGFQYLHGSCPSVVRSEHQ